MRPISDHLWVVMDFRGPPVADTVTTDAGTYRVVPGNDLEAITRSRLDSSDAELVEERDSVRELGLIK